MAKADDHVWREILGRLKNGCEMELAIGIMEPQASRTYKNSELTIGEVARIQEYGSKAAGVPPRPYLSTTFKKNNGAIRSAMRRSAAAIFLTPGSHRTAYRELGKLLVGAVRSTIFSNIPPQLADATVEKKGHDLALVDTGVLMKSITYKITRVKREESTPAWAQDAADAAWAAWDSWDNGG